MRHPSARTVLASLVTTSALVLGASVPLATPAAVGAGTGGPGSVAPSGGTASPLARAESSRGNVGRAWRTPRYRPQPGHWRDYVLASRNRTLRPVRVVRVEPRDGSVTGSPASLLRRDGRGLRITSTGDRTTSPLVVLDLGKEVSGPALVRVSAASGTRPGLHVCFSESLEYAALSPGQNSGETAHAPGCDTANIWNGFPGTPYTFDSDSHTLPLAGADLPATLRDPALRGGYRYVTLFLDSPGWVDVDDVAMRFTASPAQRDLTDYPGHFLSSDDELNKIWYAGAYTVQVNTDRADTAKSWPYATGERDHADDQVPGVPPGREVIYDGGKRDRIVWQGDLAVQAPTTFVSTDDQRAVTTSLTSLARQQLEDGFVPAESQVGQHNRDELRTYGEYVTWFVNNMAEHYRWTGDRGYLRQWWPAMRRAAAWLARQQDDTGLISFSDSGSCGHYGYSDCGHETYVNALFARNLSQLATDAAPAGQPAAAATYRRQARALRGTINAALWDDRVGAYRLSTEIPDAYPQDANATAVLTGVADRSRARRALSYLRRASWGDIGALTVAPSTPNASLAPFYAPLPSWFETEARLGAPGSDALDQQSGFDLMRRFWGWMLRQDPGSTFWEHVQPDLRPNLQQFSSLAHGWAAGPTVSLTTQVLGVDPTGPGFSRFVVRPHAGPLRWAEGVVPTPHGGVSVSWRHQRRSFSMTVRVPRGTRPTVQVPTFGQRAQLRVDGHRVGATARGGYLAVRGLGAGRHVLTTRVLGPQRPEATATLAPASTSAAPGDLVAMDATVTGRAPGRLNGTLHVSGPRGWPVSVAAFPVRLPSQGRTVSHTYRFFLRVPEDATSGAHAVRARLVVAHGGGAVTATARSVVSLSRTVTLADFEDGVDGFVAGPDVASVDRVTGFANGPGKAFLGTGALEAVGTAAPADAEHSVLWAPSAPLDLGDASQVLVRLDGYGGAPGASGYEATVRLTGAGGDVRSTTVPVSPDTWNTLTVDVSSWAARSSVSRLEVSFRALGSTQSWTPRFQVDAVQTTAS